MMLKHAKESILVSLLNYPSFGILKNAKIPERVD
jgi:hypothetical protein